MIDISRLSNLLNPAAQQQQQTFPQQNNPMIGQDMFNGGGDDQLTAALMQLLNPKDEQYDRFAQLISSIPQRQNYQPGKMRKVGAFLAGLGSGDAQGISDGQPIGYKSNVPEGLKIQSSILDQPYNQALKDWGTQAEPTLEAAKLENTRNVNSRITGGNILTQDRQRKELARKTERDEQVAKKENETLDIKREETKIRKQRADAYVYRTMHPAHDMFTSNGLLYARDPIKDTAELVRDSDGEPIESDKLGDQAKADLNLKNAKDLENLRQSNRKDLESTKQSNRETSESTRQVNREKTITARANAPKIGTSAKPETAANRHTRLFDKLVEGINKNPAWSEYVQLDKAHKVFKVDTPESKTGFFGLGAKKAGDPKIAKAITDYVYGDEKPESNTSSKPTTREDGKTKVKRKSDGAVGWVTNPDMSKYDLVK